MPRVKSTKMNLGIDGIRGDHFGDTVIHIHYDNGGRSQARVEPEHRFFVELPLLMADSLGETKVYGATQEAALVAFKDALEQFKKLKTETHRVILYEFGLSPRPESQDGRYNYSQFHDTSLKVEVWAGVFEETVATAGDGRCRYSYEKLESTLTYQGDRPNRGYRDKAQRYRKLLPWTEANERFFKYVEDSLRGLVEKLLEVEEPDNLLALVQAGRLLPLGHQAEGD